MSKGVKKVLGAVAAIAVPFVAAPLAGMIAASGALGAAASGFLGTAAGAGVTGAVLGGAASALSGGDPLTGALMGGFGGFAGGGGLQGMFGAPGATSTNAVSGPMSSSLRPPAAPGTTVGVTAGAGGGGTAGVATGTGGLGGFFQQVSQGLLNNPEGMVQLAITVFGRPPQDLTPAELANLEELKGIAETNRELFEQQVRGANEMIQMAAQQAPNPEQAFAETKIATERQLAEQTRGLGAGQASREQRRAAIRSAQTGATAAAAEEERGRRTQAALTQQGYSMLPASAPSGYAGLALPTYEALQERQYAYTQDLATAAGDLFGGIA